MAEGIYNGSIVTVIGISNTGEKIPAASGRLSTQEGNVSDIYAKSQDEAKNANLISKVTRSGHNSTIEHTYFNLAFQDVSVFVEQFLIEFRLASFTVKSRRYVNFGDCGYYIPDYLDDECKALYMSTMDDLFNEYSHFIDNDIPKEDARFLLPYCLRSNLFCSVNARELLHMLRAMLFGRGSEFAELRDLGHQLREQVEKLTPGIMIDFDKRRPTASDKIGIGFSFGGVEKVKNCDKKPVELLSFTPDAEKCVARTALTWERQYSPDTIEKIISDEKNVNKIIELVVNSTRPRPLETICYTFRVNGVSLSTITHFARHRMHNLMVPCLTQTDRENYIIPETVKANKELLDRYIKAFEKINELYNTLKAKGLTEEQLVYCQLSGNTLDIISSMNGRELMLFMKLRTCNRAQWEIRDFAIEMLRQFRQVSPTIFSKFGPSCFVGACPEGVLSCGKASEVKEFFNKI